MFARKPRLIAIIVAVLVLSLPVFLTAEPAQASGRPGRFYLLMQNIRNMACGDPDWSFDTDIRGITPDSGLTAQEIWKVSLGSTFTFDKGIATFDSGQFVPNFLVPNYPAASKFVTTRSFGTNGSFIVPSNQAYTVTFKLYTFVNNVMTAKSVARLVCSAAPRTMTEFSLENLCLAHDSGKAIHFKDCFAHTTQR
jgi:hypothetical protein